MKQLLVMAILAVGLVAACKKEKPSDRAPGSATPGSAAVAVPADAAIAAPPDASVATTPPRELPKLETDKHMVLADKPGGTVKLTLTAGGEAQLADGLVVDASKPPDGAKRPGGEDDEFVHVSSGGKTGWVSANQLVDKIEPAPQGGFALATGEIGCGDICHESVWLLQGLTARWRVFEHAVAPHAAWHPKGTHVAIGGDGELVIVELPSGKVVTKSDKYMSPAYAPDGTLYVRDPGYGVFTFDGTKATKVGKGKRPKEVEGDYGSAPEPVEFKPDGKWKLSSTE